MNIFGPFKTWTVFFNLKQNKKLMVGYGLFLDILELGVFLGPAETDYFSTFQDLKYFWASKKQKIFSAIQNLAYFWTSRDSENIPRSLDLEYFRAVAVRH